MHRRTKLLPALLLTAACAPGGEKPDEPDQQQACPSDSFVLQFGTEADDLAIATAADDNCGVVIAGQTKGLLGRGAQENSGQDIFAARLEGKTWAWTEQFGSVETDILRDMTISAAGELYLIGSAEDALPGQSHAGLKDLFVAALAPNGTQRWLRQQGSPETDTGIDVALLPGGDLLLTGATQEDVSAGYDVVMERWSADATPRWQKRLGDGAQSAPLNNELGEGVAVSLTGDIYLVGAANSSFAGEPEGSTDVFVTRLNSAGEVVWKSQRGTVDIDAALDVVTDIHGRVYVLAVSMSDLETGAPENDGKQSPFLMAYSSEGQHLWTKRIGQAGDYSRATSLVLAPDDTLFVAGFTTGNLGGTNAGGRDAFVAQLSTNGEILWSRQLGTAGQDEGLGVTLLPNGDVVLVGSTEGALGEGGHHGGVDAFVARFSAEEVSKKP